MMRWVTYSILSLMFMSFPALNSLNGQLAAETSQSVRNRLVRLVTVSQAGIQRETNDLLEPTNEYYIVSSTMDRSSHIYDITGDVLASSGKYQEWAGAVVPLGKRLFEIDYNVQKAQQVQQKYGAKVQVAWFHDSDWFTLASLDRDLTVEDLIAEYGLTPMGEYLARCTKVIHRAKAEATGKAHLTP
jgi:hypothetical protein